MPATTVYKYGGCENLTLLKMRRFAADKYVSVVLLPPPKRCRFAALPDGAGFSAARLRPAAFAMRPRLRRGLFIRRLSSRSDAFDRYGV